jgi:hypothetical protein
MSKITLLMPAMMNFLKPQSTSPRRESDAEALRHLGVVVAPAAKAYMTDHPGVARSVVEMAAETQRVVKPGKLLLDVNADPADPFLVMTVRQDNYTPALSGSLSNIWESVVEKTGMDDGWVLLTTDFKRASLA